MRNLLFFGFILAFQLSWQTALAASLCSDSYSKARFKVGQAIRLVTLNVQKRENRNWDPEIFDQIAGEADIVVLQEANPKLT